MKAVIKLDVPDWQIGQSVSVYFKDTMWKKGLCESDKFNWINVNDRLPPKNGKYLVVYKYFDYRSISVVSFATNLHKVDKYIFDIEKRPGWYEPDDEVGYFERTGVTHWAELPNLPEE